VAKRRMADVMRKANAFQEMEVDVHFGLATRNQMAIDSAMRDTSSEWSAACDRNRIRPPERPAFWPATAGMTA